MTYVLAGFSVLAGLFLMGRWLLNAEPRDILRAVKWVGGLLLVGTVLFVVVRGRVDWVLYGLFFLAPLVLRWSGVFRAIRNAAKTARGPTPGQTSEVRTRWLAMALDHDSGAMDGEVLEGPFAGRRLSGLSIDELQELCRLVEDDPQSAQVLDAWIERMHGDGSGDGAGAGSGRAAGEDSGMSRAQALEILGLDKTADETAIREAHRRLMLANHPDRGGSSWVAARINQAKDVLLGKR
ncbi:MAG: molecular chaperone DnaJ [Alphaproteobacteria bacterium]|nr:molecular chaperone DnaJ [Alphaproteobacteria bacterium]